jgi:uncharacterized protein (TIGR04141 family)
LIINVPITFDMLGQKCAEALGYFEERRYQDRYPWIDNFTRVADPLLIAELDQALVEALKTGTAENAFLTPPDTLDIQEPRGFRYPAQKRGSDPAPDLRMDDFLDQIEDVAGLTLKN